MSRIGEWNDWPTLKNVNNHDVDCNGVFSSGRYFVISQLPELYCLDDKTVTAEERREAERIYRQHMPLPEAIKSVRAALDRHDKNIIADDFFQTHYWIKTIVFW